MWPFVTEQGLVFLLFVFLGSFLFCFKSGSLAQSLALLAPVAFISLGIKLRCWHPSLGVVLGTGPTYCAVLSHTLPGPVSGSDGQVACSFAQRSADAHCMHSASF